MPKKIPVEKDIDFYLDGDLDKDLVQWLRLQAKMNHLTAWDQIRLILESAMRSGLNGSPGNIKPNG